MTSTRPVLLIVDDETGIVRFCERLLAVDFDFVHARHAREAQRILASRYDVAGVILDRDFSRAPAEGLLGPPADVRKEGLHILRWLRQAHEHLPVLMVTGHRDQAAALEVAELAADYLVWADVTNDPRILSARLRRVLSADGEESERALHAFHARGVIGEAPVLRRALARLFRYAFEDGPILLLGETGTGKDLLASAVHQLSRDQTHPFVAVNVAALAPTLVESELFGHRRGAFTGATQDRLGKLRLADGGTLFLNEIADLAPEIQAKLLTVLEQDEVVPVGGDRPQPARFRLIAATSRDLRGLTESGTFRPDLYYRLAWHAVEVPPLRRRGTDVPLLVQHFLQRLRGRGADVAGLTPEASQYLAAYDWPGNVRQLQAALTAACAMADYVVTLKDVREVLCVQEPGLQAAAVISAQARAAADPSPAPTPASPTDPFADLDFDGLKRAYFHHLLRRADGNLTRVAELAGIGRTTAFEWARKYGRASEARG